MSTDICLPMKRSPVTGLFSRDETFVECQMRRSHIYSDVAKKGDGILHLEKKVRFGFVQYPRGAYSNW